MRVVLFLIIFLKCHFLFSQSIFFYESKVIDFNVPRSSDSYERRFVRISNKDTVIRKNEFPAALYWQPINDNELVGCNVWTCGKLNIVTNHFDTLYHNKQKNIVELSCNDNYCYLVITNNEMERFDNSELIRISLSSSEIEKVDISGKYNILNLYASNNNLAFVDYEYFEENDNEKFIFTIYNLETKESTKVDSALLRNNEWFGRFDDGATVYWENESTLYYFKKEKDNSNGYIFKLDLKNMKVTREFELPFDGLKSFALYENGFVIINGGKIIKVDRSGNQRIVYRVGYKYDYIDQEFYIIK